VAEAELLLAGLVVEPVAGKQQSRKQSLVEVGEGAQGDSGGGACKDVPCYPLARTAQAGGGSKQQQQQLWLDAEMHRGLEKS
jgi:hypothetical protein